MNPPTGFLLSLIRGSIGKEFVVKKYGSKVVVTRFPDMTRILPSLRQAERRKLFAHAVAFAQRVKSGEEQEHAKKIKTGKHQSLFQAAIKYYLIKDKREREKPLAETERLLNKALKNSGTVKTVRSSTSKAKTRTGLCTLTPCLDGIMYCQFFFVIMVWLQCMQFF